MADTGKTSPNRLHICQSDGGVNQMSGHNEGVNQIWGKEGQGDSLQGHRGVDQLDNY